MAIFDPGDFGVRVCAHNPPQSLTPWGGSKVAPPACLPTAPPPWVHFLKTLIPILTERNLPTLFSVGHRDGDGPDAYLVSSDSGILCLSIKLLNSMLKNKMT